MGDPFAGNWKHYSSENLDEFMKVMGAPWIARKMASATSPTVEAIVDGDHYKFTMSSPGWSMATEFDIGREFMLSLPDGSKKKSIVVRDGDKKLLQRTEHDGFEEKTTREIKDGELVVIMEAKDVTCVRKFKRS